MWRVIHTQKVQRYDHYNSIAALKRWVDNVITAEHVCVCVCVCALYRRRQRHCWPLIQAGLLFLLYHTNVCTSHTDWVSWEITADRTPGLRFTLRKLYFIENSSQLVLDCPPAHGEASIPTSCYVCLLLAKAVLSWANPAIIFHQGLEARGVGWGVPLCVTVIWVLLLFMVEVKVIIVTHGNPRHTGWETALKGDAGEKGLACGTPAVTDTLAWVCTHALTRTDTFTVEHRHTCTQRHGTAYTRSCRTRSHWPPIVLLRSAVTQLCFI